MFKNKSKPQLVTINWTSKNWCIFVNCIKTETVISENMYWLWKLDFIYSTFEYILLVKFAWPELSETQQFFANSHVSFSQLGLMISSILSVHVTGLRLNASSYKYKNVERSQSNHWGCLAKHLAVIKIKCSHYWKSVVFITFKYNDCLEECYQIMFW